MDDRNKNIVREVRVSPGWIKAGPAGIWPHTFLIVLCFFSITVSWAGNSMVFTKPHQVIDSIIRGLEDLKDEYPPMEDFDRNKHMRGQFIQYSKDIQWKENPNFEKELQRMEEEHKGRISSQMKEQIYLRKKLPVFHEKSLYLLIRFDNIEESPPPVLSEYRFGNYQITILEVQGPDTKEFREFKKKVYSLVQQAVDSYTTK